MSEFHVNKENRDKFREIEAVIEQAGWDVHRKSVTDRHMIDGEKHLKTELVLTKKVDNE